LTWTNPSHAEFFPRKAIILQATLGEGVNYNRKSAPAALWRVPDEIGMPNGMGTPGMLLAGTLNGNNGGLFGSRTLAQVYPGFASSIFVRAAQFIQDAEDAVYSHDWIEKGYGMGSYLNYIDIDSLIDWHIAHEMMSDWEVNTLNGKHMYYDPSIGKLRMGPIWDLKRVWNRGELGANPDFVRKTPFWLKEILGWEIPSSSPGFNINNGREIPGRKDPYYVDRIKARWNEVSGLFNTELDPYIDATNNRFERISGFYMVSPIPINGYRTGLKNTITDMRGRLNTVFNGY